MATTPRIKDGIVYRATAPSGKSYIGISSKGLEARKKSHMNDAKRGVKRPFAAAIRKYGDDISWEILAKSNCWKELQRLECNFIKKFDTYKSGYNLTLGGDGHMGFKQSPQTIALRSRKISAAKKGKKLSKEHIRALSRAKMGNTNRRGTTVSEESRLKISKSQDGKVKPIICIETGIQYRTARDAARELNLCRANLQKHLKRLTHEKYKNYKTIKGFTFKYKERQIG